MHSFKLAIERVMGNQNQNSAARPLERRESEVDGKHILVVDDVEINRMILVKILGSMGATCGVTENGLESTKAIRSNAHPDADTISIITMTANAFMDAVQDALADVYDALSCKRVYKTAYSRDKVIDMI